MKRMQATVIGDSAASARVCALAEEVGALLARRGITVITGGAGGVMEAACRGAANAGGTTVGILPGENLAGANRWCSIVIPTGLSHARNALTVLAGDVIIVVGGAAGTLSEISLASIHGKPILALRGSGGWADRLAGTAVDDRRGSPIVSCGTIGDLEREIDTILGRQSARPDQ